MRRLCALGLCWAACATALVLGVATASARGPELPLGRASLEERRSTVRVASGVVWTRIVRGNGSRRRSGGGPWRVNVLTIDRGAYSGRVSAVLSSARVAGRETTSSMARRTGAVAGVNGGFFVSSGPGDGDPVGALALDGDLVSEPVDGRTSLLVPRSRASPAALATLRFAGGVAFGDRRRILDGVDRIRGVIPGCGGRGGDRPTQRARHALTCVDPSELVLLSPRFATTTRTPPHGAEAVVREGVVTALRRGGNTPIPRDGFVLSGSGDAATFLRLAAVPGRRPAVSTSVLGPRAPLRLEDYDAIASGGPRLVEDGRIAVRAGAEGFGPGGNAGLFRRFVAGRNPRTLAGVGADGRLRLVTVDGRQRASVGVTLREAARVMRALGARDALNLDGGGSTTMIIGRRVVNRPSDAGGERPVGVGIFVLP